jgi:four helix bundle protein
MIVRSYRDLRVWQRSLDLVQAVYAITRRLPREERYALGDQLRRSVGSVAANIAEGHTRAHRKEFLQFLAVAQASLTEVETHLIIVERVGYLEPAPVGGALGICGEVGRMLTVMRARLRDASPDSRQSPTLASPQTPAAPLPD